MPHRLAANMAVDARPVLRLSLFGPLTLQFGEREIRTRSLKLRAMLGYIALSDKLRETRERLVGLLWSESAETQARAVLRQVVRELRGLFEQAGFDGLHVDPYEIGFEPDAIQVDVSAVLGAAEAGEVHPLLLEQPRLGDELLTGLEDVDPAFRGWIIAKRETVRDRLLRSLETALVGDGLDDRRQAKLAEAILNLDPTHEEACRRLMRARAVSGDTAGALRAYKNLWDLLDEEHGMEPAAATQRLVADIKVGLLEPPLSEARAPAVPAARVAPKAETRLRLLLREATIHAIDADKVHLVEGFRQHVIASLVRFREWQVTDAPFPATTSAAEAAGRYELRMTAHQSGQAVHLLLMLKELETSLYIWSDGFELRLESWFDIAAPCRPACCDGAQRVPVGRAAPALLRAARHFARHLRPLAAVPDAGSHLRCAVPGIARRSSSPTSSRRRRISSRPIAGWRICRTSATSRSLASSVRVRRSARRWISRSAPCSSIPPTRARIFAWPGRTPWRSSTPWPRPISDSPASSTRTIPGR